MNLAARAPLAWLLETSAWLGSLLLLLCAHARAQAGPYTPIGTDLLMQGRPAEGLLILHSGYRNSPYVDADAVVFMGGDEDGARGDVLAVNVGLREPHGYGQARIGRFVLSTGAVRPVPIDGARVLASTPSGSTLEVFGGLPVVPELGPRSYDWLAGARLAQHFAGDLAGVGLSYLQRRDAGELANEELGADLSVTPADWLGVNALGAWDVLQDGLAEARVSADVHDEHAHAELFATRRVASRLLPATSLFSVISAAPSSELGSELWLRAFPRLDVGGTLAFEALSDRLGYRVALRTTLRFADADAGDVALEGTRRKLGDEGWTGCAVRSQLPIDTRLRVHASVEVVRPDHENGDGALWPWTRAGASYALGDRWLVAAAVGARATPEYSAEMNALLRVSYNSEVMP